MDLIQKTDLDALTFSNSNSAGAGGVSIRTDAGSIIGNALAGLGSVTSGTANPVDAPVKVPAVYFNTANDTLWFWTGVAWELSGRNYTYSSNRREVSSQVLTAADAGICLSMQPTTNGITIELPLRTDVLAGSIFDLVNVSVFPITVLVSNGSADLIISGINSAASFTLNPQTSIRITRIQSSQWHVLFGSQLSTAFAAAGVPAGAVSAFAQATAPAGWLKANGALVSRSAYATLFAEIGVTYGAGDGSTTFALPDLRGEFVRGWDDGRGADIGRAFGTLQGDAFQGHVHLPGAGMANFVGNASGAQNTAAFGDYVTGWASSVTGQAYTDGVSGQPRLAYETRPRNVAMLFCIKY